MPFDQIRAFLHALHISIPAHPGTRARQRPAKLNASHRIPSLYQEIELTDTLIVMQVRHRWSFDLIVQYPYHSIESSQKCYGKHYEGLHLWYSIANITLVSLPVLA